MKYLYKLIVILTLSILTFSCEKKITLLNCPTNDIATGGFCSLALQLQKFFGASNFNYIDQTTAPLVVNGPSSSAQVPNDQETPITDFLEQNNNILLEKTFGYIYPFFSGNYNYCQVDALSKLANGKKTRFTNQSYFDEGYAEIIEVNDRVINTWIQNGNVLRKQIHLNSALESFKIIEYFQESEGGPSVPSYYMNFDFVSKEALVVIKNNRIFRGNNMMSDGYISKMKIIDKQHMTIIANDGFALNTELLLYRPDYYQKNPFVLANGVLKDIEGLMYFNRNQDLYLAPATPNSYQLPTETITYDQSILDSLPQNSTIQKTDLSSEFVDVEFTLDMNRLYQQYFVNCLADKPLDTPLPPNYDTLSIEGL